MKKQLLLALLFFPLLSAAQDWKSVRLTDTTYYTIPAHHGYLRTIWIDSTQAIGTDSVFYFYPSIRLGNTTTQCLDTLGPTWLGTRFIKKQNGDEVFFNRWLDSIHLQPQAALNTSWMMHTDSSGLEYRGTITALDTLTVDNQVDSVKEITITVFANNLPDSSHHHFGTKMLLSKSHGFIECLEWYLFPYQDTMGASMYGEIFPTISTTHQRLPRKYYEQTRTWQDLNVKYQAGNYWQHRYQHKKGPNAPYYIPFIYYVQDSIVQVHQVNADSVDVSFQRRNYTVWTKAGAPDSISKSLSNLRHTLYAGDYDPLKSLHPEFSNLSADPYGESIYYYIPSIACDRIVVRQSDYPFAVMDVSQTGCYKETLPISSTYTIHTNTWSGFGQITKNSEAFGQPIQSDAYPHQESLVYAKLGACDYGTPISFTALAVDDVFDPASIRVFPNPAHSRIYVTALDANPIESVRLFSLQGQPVRSCTGCDELSIASLAKGFYVLRIQTKQGSVQKKVLIE